ncbi:MAG: ATP-dependent zinc metalloprotease FtsH [Chloroflexi bacterium]|nr:ATP-dependent zinc metalloprotease FtsH [Anaerolineae bacterium]MCC6565374.1 ATP-dependent zinc metalloprotease FtsH [Chloroflexota bacterium]MDL1916154.1 ATP-dependent zinc metalloprotease FtsH [Anaerolineae bacterium CFX4]MCO6442527.1 ATP-dependent zinc metalloprotease FtsH [Anaerolineae bacterium]MEB2366294.1 ATP-dependent zinc metalloprotease FtsH [Chloroflexota bacterium]
MLANNRGVGGGGDLLTYNELAHYIQQGRVARLITSDNGDVVVHLEGRNQPLRTFKEPLINLREEMYDLGVTEEQWRSIDEISAIPSDNTSSVILNLAIAIVPTLLIVWLLWRMMRSVRVGQDQAMSFGRSRARVNRDVERPQVTFADVAGAEEAKEELKEVVEFLKEPDKFIRLGARVPKGVLMVGPPGTGKTLMARAVAGEAGVPFFSISGSEFVEMFVGVGASRVRDLFDRAKAEAPAIVFVDEIDAVGRHRGAGLGGGHDEREQTLNQILVEMDGFETGTNVIVLASTNRPDILDPALLRPGRFDRKVVMDNPDVKGRLDILKVHAKGKPLAQSVDLEAIAKITPGFSGADLENLINEAAILAARRNLKNIGMSELQEAMERVIMGPERKTRVISEAEKKKIAYHEAGHAILQHVLEYADPVHKITIVPRGRAGGYVMSLPESDSMLKSREEFEDDIVAAMGGRAAEEIVFNQLTTGASSDIQQATRIARAMVTKFGMSELLGPRSYDSSSGNIFLGRELSEMREYSEHYAEEIDNEVRSILQRCYDRAKTILSESREKLDTLADALIEHETLDRSTFEQLMTNLTGQQNAQTPALFDTQPPQE